MTNKAPSLISKDKEARFQLRWVLSFLAIWFAWAITPFSIFDREFGAVDFDVGAKDSIHTLERLTYRYDFIGQGKSTPACPGQNCPLNVMQQSPPLRYEMSRTQFLPHVMTLDGWRGIMYVRWETEVPSFVDSNDDAIAFDFLGIAGRRWRFFVNGVEQGAGPGGTGIPAVVFKTPGPSGSPLVLGFEIDVGRTLAPGVILSAQPFLSRPEVARFLRAAYVGLDKEHLLPMTIAPTVIALLAAFGCLLTPFYREILAFSVWVSLINWRFLLTNNLVPYPASLNVDFVTLSAILCCAILAAQWAFFGLFYRVKSNLRWMPVMCYGLMVVMIWLAGRTGIGLDVVLWMHHTWEIHLVVGFLVASGLGFSVWKSTKKMTWARYRAFVSLVVATASACMALAQAGKGLYLFLGVDLGGLLSSELVYVLTTYGTRALILLIGFAIALEWAMIVRERQRVLQRFGRVVDPRLVHEIIHGPENESKVIPQVVVLFVDIRSFTSICEVFSPEEVVRVLNDYLNVVTTAIQNNGGTIDKFVGDAVLAIWGVPQSSPNDHISAVRTAIDIRMGIAELNVRREGQGQFGIDVGIGIHVGAAIFGAMGNGSRVDHTVIGPTINLAARLESMTKDLKCDILISHSVLSAVEDFVLIEDFGPMEIRGMSSRMGVARLIGLQISNGDFLIGDDFLEKYITVRSPGKIAGVPVSVHSRDYAAGSVVKETEYPAA